MKQYGIPGMAVGVTIGGTHYLFNYGVASKATKARVEPSTLFEIGSITKTFTASLTSYAQLTGKLSLQRYGRCGFSCRCAERASITSSSSIWERTPPAAFRFSFRITF